MSGFGIEIFMQVFSSPDLYTYYFAFLTAQNSTKGRICWISAKEAYLRFTFIIFPTNVY